MNNASERSSSGPNIPGSPVGLKSKIAAVVSTATVATAAFVLTLMNGNDEKMKKPEEDKTELVKPDNLQIPLKEREGQKVKESEARLNALALLEAIEQLKAVGALPKNNEIMHQFKRNKEVANPDLIQTEEADRSSQLSGTETDADQKKKRADPPKK